MARLRDRVTVLNAPVVVDPYNPNSPTSQRDWDAATARPEQATIRPLTSTETLLNADTIVSRWRILLPPDTTATGASRIKWRGLTFEIDGEVQPVPDHLARIRNHAAFLTRVT